jgi:hypothetical protein
METQVLAKKPEENLHIERRREMSNTQNLSHYTLTIRDLGQKMKPSKENEKQLLKW